MQIKTKIKNLDNYKKYLKIQKTAEEFLQKRGYLKVDLPILSPALIPESYLEIFETKFTYLGKSTPLYLTPSPELFLKRLLVQGIGNCYYLGKSFRNNDSPSSLHSFEFTMLEYYKMGAEYMELADELLEMLKFIAGNKYITYQGKTISFDSWEKIKVEEAFEKFAGIKNEELFDHKKIIEVANKKGYQTKGFSFEDIFSQIYTQEVEPNLGMNGFPTLIYDYPKEFAALAKHNSDGKTAQRFEFYIAGIELGDCYSELTDWREQYNRFKIEDNYRQKTGKIKHPVDHDFIDSLRQGLKSCAGIAIGFERLAMIYCDAPKIADLKLINIE